MERLFTLQHLVKYQVITIVRFYHKTNSGIPLTSAPSLTEVDKIRITCQLQLWRAFSRKKKKNGEALAHLVAMLPLPLQSYANKLVHNILAITIYCMCSVLIVCKNECLYIYSGICNVDLKIVPHRYKTRFGQAADLSIRKVKINYTPSYIFVTVHGKRDQLGQKIKSELLISLCRTHL